MKRKGDESLSVFTPQTKRRTAAILMLRNDACVVAQGDGTACRDKELVQCDLRSKFVTAIEETCPNGRVAAGGKASCK